MNQPTKTVNIQGIMNEMERIVSNSLTGCTFAHIKTVTTPKLNKKGRNSGLTLNIPADQIRKISEFGIGLGYDYKKSIENKLIKEGKDVTEYEAGETWHRPFENSKVIVEHKTTGEKYFKVSLNANNKPTVKYVDVVTGKEIDKSEIAEFLPPEHTPKNQGVEQGNEVLIRTLKLESLKSLSACGEVYEVV